MTRSLRYCPAGLPVHIIQRGNNRNDCFFSEKDKAVYLRLLKNAAQEHEVFVHAWVLMSNHSHLLATPGGDGSISKMMQSLGGRYVRYINGKYTRTGTLWEGRFRSCLVQDSSYFLTCQRYIELNPVRAGMVRHPGKFRWSSYPANAEGRSSSLRTPHEIYLSLGPTSESRCNAYRKLFDELIDRSEIEAIRSATNKGLVFGSERFKDRLEVEGCRRTRLLKRGPKPALAG